MKQALLSLIMLAGTLAAQTFPYDHVHVNVPDPKAAADWYEKYFGGKRITEAPNRLMFGAALVTAQEGRPKAVVEAGAESRAIMAEIIRRGAAAGVFSAALRRDEDLSVAALSAWSTVHGLTTLIIDRIVDIPRSDVERTAKQVTNAWCDGLMRG